MMEPRKPPRLIEIPRSRRNEKSCRKNSSVFSILLGTLDCVGGYHCHRCMVVVMKNVISLADHANDGSYNDPVTLLRGVIAELENGVSCDACLVIMLDCNKGQFDVGFRNSKMTTSQIIAVCEVMKARCLAMMGWLKGPDS